MERKANNKRKTTDDRTELTPDPKGFAKTVLKKLRSSSPKDEELSPADQIQKAKDFLRASIEALVEEERKFCEPFECPVDFPDVTPEKRQPKQVSQTNRPQPTKRFLVGPTVVRVRGQDYWRRGKPDTFGSFGYVWFLYNTAQLVEPPSYVLKYESPKAASKDQEIGRRINKLQGVCPFIAEYIETIDYRPYGELGR